MKKPGPLKNDIVFELLKGTSKKTLIEDLASKGIISSRIIFYSLSILNHERFLPKAGEYKFNSNISPKELYKKLNNGEVLQRKILIKEGLRSIDIINIINENLFLESFIYDIPNEGSVFPDTYYYTKGEDKNNIIKRMQAKMEMKLSEIWALRDKNLPYKSPNDLIIMASMIEKETGNDNERELVASVFINRINNNMRLQSDPTVVYGKYRKANQIKKIRSLDINKNHPWNTYQIKGLPKTAICNPSEAAMIAASKPKNTNYFYFVSNGNGGHNFSKTLKEHNNNVRKLKTMRKK